MKKKMQECKLIGDEGGGGACFSLLTPGPQACQVSVRIWSLCIRLTPLRIPSLKNADDF